MTLPDPIVRGRRTRLLCVIAGVVISACGGEPTESDLQLAFQTSVGKAQAMAYALTVPRSLPELGNLAETELHDVRKLGCQRAKDVAGYVCEVEVDVTAPLIGRTTQIGTVRMVRGTDGWQVLEH
ncbi:MAG: hypothetical protein AB7T20_07145 [Steroidobacteraceae bacterium]